MLCIFIFLYNAGGLAILIFRTSEVRLEIFRIGDAKKWEMISGKNLKSQYISNNNR